MASAISKKPRLLGYVGLPQFSGFLELPHQLFASGHGDLERLQIYTYLSCKGPLLSLPQLKRLLLESARLTIHLVRD